MKPLYSKQAEARLQAGIDIWDRSAIERDALGFSTRIFAQCNLPHKAPPPGTELWVRRNGKATFTIQPGFRIEEDGTTTKLGLPYGMVPRLLMIYFVSQAIRTKNRRIDLGDSLSDFLKRIGLPRDTRTIRMLKKQVELLATAHMQFTFSDPENGMRATMSGAVIKGSVTFWDTKHPEQQSLWKNYIDLNADFHAEIIKNGFPLDLDAVAALRKSPLALDLYSWLAYRMKSINRPTNISWESLHSQVGADYTNLYDFRKKALHALRMIRTVWHDLAFDSSVQGCLTLIPSPTPVAPAEKPKTVEKVKNGE